jgi:arylsulfatase A-like enzyme
MRWDAGGDRILWEAQASALPGIEAEGLVVEKSKGRRFWRRSRGGACAIVLPVWGHDAPLASDSTAVRALLSFTAPQTRSPRARVTLETHSGPAVSALATATADGDQWILQADFGPAPPQSVTALRFELATFQGETFDLKHVEILGSGEVEGLVAQAQDGETRSVMAAAAGSTLALRGAPAEGGRLVGEVARHPAARASRDAITAEVIVSLAGQETRRRLRLRPGTAWMSYELPTPSGSGTASVRLKTGPEGGLLWSEPVFTASQPRRGRGVLLISIDTLRADAVFPPEGQEPLMPLLARRARREGQAVRHHYAAANWTLPAHTSMLTGRYPTSHGAAQNDAILDLSSATSLPQVFARDGFYSAGIVDGGYLSARYGFAAAFDRYREPPPGPRTLGWHDKAFRELLPRLHQGDFFVFLHSYFLHDYYDPDSSAEEPPKLPPRLASFAAKHHGGLLQFAEAHEPGDPWDARFRPLMQALYAQRARVLDRWLDAFLETLATELPGTLVVITSDHGECLGEGPGASCWGHGNTTREEEVRVPLVVLQPDRRARPEVTGVTSQVDIAPTLLHLAGIAAPEHAYSGLDLLDPAALRNREEIYVEDYYGARNGWAAVSRRLKLVARSVLVPAAHRAETRELFRAPPGAIQEDAPEPAEGAEVRAIERRRRDALYADVSGLFLQFDNPSTAAEHVDLELAEATKAASFGADLPFHAHMLEREDAVGIGGRGQPLRLALTLEPGDTDLLILTGTSELALHRARGASLTVVHGRDTVAGEDPILVGGTRSPAADHPPPPPARSKGVVLRVWRNVPPGSPHYRPGRQPLSGKTYENLRALGYVH